VRGPASLSLPSVWDGGAAPRIAMAQRELSNQCNPDNAS